MSPPTDRPAGEPVTSNVAGFFVPTVEARTTERIAITESVEGSVRESGSSGNLSGSLITVDVLRSGWNSSGSRYYPREVVTRDIPTIYGRGCHMHINHPSTTEREDQPERSLKTLAAVFLEDPYPVEEADGRVVMRTTARVFSDWQTFLAERAEVIGVSINGGGTGNWGEAEGREGLVLESLTYGQSVDFVTKPGAGGRILALLEADRTVATTEAGTLGAWLEAQMHLGFTQLADGMYGDGRLTRDERITASSAVGDALAAFVKAVEDRAPQLYQRDRWAVPDGADTATREAITVEATAEQTRNLIDRALHAAYVGSDPDRYAWVRDYDPDLGTVWFTAGGRAVDSRIWMQQYERRDGAIVLLGDRTEVREKTVYEPVSTTGDQVATKEAPDDAPAPAGSITATEADTTAKEIVMGDDTATREAEAARTAEAAAQAVRTAEALELARYRVADQARSLLDTRLAESDLSAPAQARVRAGFPATTLPLLESEGRPLNTDLFNRTVEAAISAESGYVAQILESAGVGKVTGNGAAQGAGAGAPLGYGQVPAGGGSVLFGAPLGTPLGAALPVALSEADQARMASLREVQIKAYTDRGMTREAAEKSVDAY